MSIRLVQFHNGKYGIQRRTIVDRIFGLDGTFQDLIAIQCSWSKKSHYFKDCESSDFDKVSDIYLRLSSSVVSCEIKQKRLNINGYKVKEMKRDIIAI